MLHMCVQLNFQQKINKWNRFSILHKVKQCEIRWILDICMLNAYNFYNPGQASFSCWLLVTLVALGTSVKQNHAQKSSYGFENLTNGSIMIELVNNDSSFTQNGRKLSLLHFFPISPRKNYTKCGELQLTGVKLGLTAKFGMPLSALSNNPHIKSYGQGGGHMRTPNHQEA